MQRFVDQVLNFFRGVLGRPRHYRIKARTGRFTAPFGAAVAMAVFLFSCAPAYACNPIAEVFTAAAQYGMKVIKLDAEQTKLVTADFNAAPPATNESFDAIYVVHGQGGDAVFLTNGGCIEHQGLLPPGRLSAILGRDA